MKARVNVAATSANLGPGYDCAGLALGLFDTLEAQAMPSGQLVIDIEGEGSDTVARDEGNLVVRAIARGFAEAAEPMPGLWLRCVNRIPHGRGLGSSSAAIVGGLALARGLLPNGPDQLTPALMVALATELEGHPDNVAPAILGGFTLAWTQEGVGRAVRLEPHPDLEPVVAIPPTPLATTQAREVLPAVVPHADAARNVGRAALLVEAITRRPDLLLPATQDWLHQDYRRSAYPESHALLMELRGKGAPAMISGAGPTVIVLGVKSTALDGAALVTLTDEIARTAAADFVVWELDVASAGLVLTE